MLETFKDSLGKRVEFAVGVLDRLQWEGTKHIFTEEKVLFKFCSKAKPQETCNLVKKLAGDHNVILEMIDSLKDDLAFNAKINIAGFQEFVKKHREIEERDLYPKLDKELSESEKKKIIARISEITLKK